LNAQTPDANREHKNSVFTMLFNDKAVLLELSNALFGTHYGADTPIEVTTLKNALSRGRVNDLSDMFPKFVPKDGARRTTV